MRCPNCGELLGFATATCPSCGAPIAQRAEAALEVQASAKPLREQDEPKSGSEWVTLTTCSNLLEADLIMAQLEGGGVKARLPDEFLMQTVAWNVNTFGYIRVEVAAQDYDAAKTLLAKTEQKGAKPPETNGESELRPAQIPLSWPMRCFAFVMPAFVCPGFLLFAVARGGYVKQGCERKARELWHWFAAGIVFWFIAFIALLTRLDRQH